MTVHTYAELLAQITPAVPKSWTNVELIDLLDSINAGAAGGGIGGGLPSWWTVDSTPGSESIDFAGVGIFNQNVSTIPALRLNSIAPASTNGENLISIFDENGDQVGQWEANGRIYARNAAWTTEAGIAPDGFLSLKEDPATYSRQLIIANQWGVTGQWLFRFYAPGAGYLERLSPQNAADRGLTIEAFTAQTADLAYMMDENGVYGLRIDKRGGPIIGVTSAPADGALSASQMAIWFDDTNGAAKLKVKAKTADGTVVTGSVNLA